MEKLTTLTGVCIAAVERTSGLRDSIPVGAMLSMEAGSAAQILLAWEDSDRLHQGLRHAKFTATKLAAGKYLTEALVKAVR